MNTGQKPTTTAGLPVGTPPIISDFSNRRDPHNQRKSTGMERRQFVDSMDGYTDEAAELGLAIDQYKLMHRRRFINYEELLAVIKSVGYEKKS